jgi:hypothetical protein
VKTCIEGGIENGDKGSNIRAVWRNCTGNSEATGAEALEGFWTIMADENGKYGDCNKTSETITSTTPLSGLATLCNIR